MQHNMSPATFEAKMALGSWASSSVGIDVQKAADIIARHEDKGKQVEGQRLRAPLAEGSDEEIDLGGVTDSDESD
jgi:hypothetical protein